MCISSLPNPSKFSPTVNVLGQKTFHKVDPIVAYGTDAGDKILNPQTTTTGPAATAVPDAQFQSPNAPGRRTGNGALLLGTV